MAIGNYNPSMLGVALATSVVVGAGCAGYQSMAPTARWYGPTFMGLKPGSKQLALTYDDGPNDPHTLRLLEVLARNNVRATFFVIGRFVKQRPDIVRELVKAGHTVGNHTFSHPNLIFASAPRARTELRDCELALTEAVGEHSRLFRPPFGGRRPTSLRIARELGLQPVMWNVTGWDWNERSADYVEAKVKKQIRGGEVILLHDGGHKALGADRSQTVIATDRIISSYKSQGYEFVTIPEMMGQQAVSSQQSAVS